MRVEQATGLGPREQGPSPLRDSAGFSPASLLRALLTVSAATVLGSVG